MTSPPIRFVQGRFGLLYATMFMVIGVRVPYFPVWLESRGLGPVEIGVVLMVTALTRMAAYPVTASIADRSGDRRRLIVIFAFIGTVFGMFLLPMHTFWGIALVTALWSCTFPMIMPLCESLAIAVAYERKLDYGRFRLWGSISFIVAVVGAGQFLPGRAADFILWLIIATLALTAISSLLIPEDPRPPQAVAEGRQALRRVFILALHPTFLVFLLAMGLILGSHAVFFGFATLHWRALGFSGLAVGILWAATVVAEVGIFAVSNRIVDWLGPVRLIAIAGVACVLRWGLSGVATDFWILLLLQVLNGLTYGAAHLGAIHFIARAVPPSAAASGQSLYSAISMGAVMGLASFGAGFLYEAYSGGAYLAMAVLAALGMVFVAALGRRWDGGAVTI